MNLNDAHALLRHHRALIARLARHVGRSHAEDLAGEALLRTVRRPAPDGRQAPWLERICRNLRIDHQRRQMRFAATIACAPEPTPAATPEDEAFGRERRDALRAAIPRMPPNLQQALIGRFADDLGYDDLAEREGISIATARTRVFRALDRLRAALGQLRTVLCAPTGFAMNVLGPTLITPALTAILVLPTLVSLPPAAAGGPALTLPAQAATTTGNRRPVSQTSPKPPVVVPRRSGPIGPLHAPTDIGPAFRKAPPPLNAEPRGPAHTDPTARNPPAVQRFDYEDDKLEGSMDKPPVEWVTGDPGPAPHPSLIEIPRSFDTELAKTLEDL